MVVAVSGATERSGSAAQRITGAVIRAYRLLISPWLGARCRFEPSCSRFTEEAVQRYGVIKGVALGVRRLGSCHPFHPGGFDPVP